MYAQVFATNAEAAARRIGRDRALEGAPGVQVVNDGVILPLRPSEGGAPENFWGGVTDSRGEFVAGHRVHRNRGHKLNVSTAYPIVDEPFRRDEVVIYAGGGGLGHFGHFLTEGLARLWWLFEEGNFDHRIVFSAVDLTRESPSFQLLTQAGLDPDRVLFLTEPTRFETVIVPDQAFFLGSGDYYPGRALAVYDAIRGSVSPAEVSKVYLTRSSFRDPLDRLRERDESMLEDVYRSQGFEIVAPETLPLAEQIAIVAGAEELASTVGTLSHWVLASPTGVRQDAILRHPTSIRMDGQWGMSSMRQADLSVVATTLDLLPGSRWAGVVAHAATPHWVRFVRQRFGIDVPAADLGSLIPPYVRDWAELLSSLPEDQLGFIPAWSVADLVEHVSRELIGRPLDAETLERLRRHFPKPTPGNASRQAGLPDEHP